MKKVKIPKFLQLGVALESQPLPAVVHWYKHHWLKNAVLRYEATSLALSIFGCFKETCFSYTKITVF